MPQQDTAEIKEKIISILRKKGPSLPVHIAEEINTSALFTSAFLSELISERKIKISNMKIGNSPLYFIPGQEPLLEKFSNYLKKKEKDAFILLQEKKFLKDSEQEPAIRVALRSIKDFAIPIKKNNELYWKYFKEQNELIDKEDLKEKEIQKKESLEKITLKKEKSNYELNKKEQIKKDSKIKKQAKKSSQKTNDKFFNRVKKHLSSKNIEIIDIESFNKNELFFIVKKNTEKFLLAALNKKRINENDLIKINKKAKELKLKYIILNTGDLLKKMKDLIDAIQNLSSIEKME